MNINYWLDSDNIITSVSENWDIFAFENNGVEAISSKVINTSIFSHINDDVTRMWLDTFIQSARYFNKSVEREYRCDSFAVKRFMKMTITPESCGTLRLEHTLLQKQNYKKQVKFEYDKSWKIGDLVRCSICNRIKHGDNWKDSDYISDINSGVLPVAYSVCQACLDKIK